MAGYYIRTQEHREKMSRIFKGRKNTWIRKGRLVTWGAKISEGKTGTMLGADNSAWKGGKIQRECLFCKIKFQAEPHKKDKKFCSRKCKGLWQAENLVGENNPCWRGGATALIIRIRGLKKYASWRESVFKRDGYICQDCGFDKGNILEAHHIIFVSDCIKNKNLELIFDVNNGLTLCKKCHKKMHLKNNLKEIMGGKLIQEFPK